MRPSTAAILHAPADEPTPSQPGALATPSAQVFWVLAAALGALATWHAWASQFNHDEIEHLHAAWLVGRGQTPFVDFLEQHHPTLWYLLAPATRWFGSVRGLVFAARLLDLGWLVGALAAVRGLLRRTYPAVPARWPLLLLASSFMFVRNTMEVRPDPLMNLLLYAGLLAWIGFVQEGRLARAVLAGVLFGGAAAVLQKAAVVVALATGGTLLVALLRRRGGRPAGRLLLGAGAMLAAAAIPLAALFAFIAGRGYFREFWFWNYAFNRFFYTQARIAQHFSVWITVALSALEDPALWIAGVAGMALALRELWRSAALDREAEARLVLLVAALGYAPFLALNRFPLEQYFLALLPLLAIFSADAFARATAPRPRAWLVRGALFMPVVLAVILAFHPRSGEQRRVQDEVLAATRPDEAVFLTPPFNPVFRLHAGYFWYNGDMISGAYAEYCRRSGACAGEKLALDEALWAERPPAFVYVEHPEYAPYRWAERAAAFERAGPPGLLRRARVAR
jgi:hypothetical protein